jgi:uncharacterized protein
MNFEEHLKDSATIIVRPGSSKSEITGYDEERKALRVNIKAPPEDNKANIEIIRFFSKLTGRQVKIISGLKAKKKIIRLC